MSSKKEEYERRRQEKEAQHRSRGPWVSPRTIKTTVVILALASGIGLVGWYMSNQPSVPEENIVSRRGLHWHPELTIAILGKKQEISANIGIGIVHKPMHTHDTSGTVHLEMQGLVTKDMITLGQFFENWGKRFNQNCILDFCNGPEGTVKLLVNNQESRDFEKYRMQDKDKIEIRYE